ncbi:hypothetical protein [Kitasatospora cathayae]|uniref:HEAT repeat domain-containing protein n=1 Tax=Kitasatospora cathayae TaxID=3004092 RepID=A0ABY7QAX2_9ACTN|nr:hypothetical protein [Kitasatospora sp. HUAS 3-15]WBP89271.1 hypothetical protein O1G21_27795 [Kitasatospora sp. HUAS 3-15]
MSDEATASHAERGGADPAVGDRSVPAGDATAEKHPAPSGTADEGEGPLNEAAALVALSKGADDPQEWADAARVAQIADLIAHRLRDDPSGLRIGTLALFQDTVSFGGGFNVHGHAAERTGVPASAGGSLARIEPDEQNGHLACYVRPHGYKSALELLQECHLIVLAQPPGTGRAAAAVNLLVEALIDAGAADGGSCYRSTDPSAVLSATWTPPHQNAGYLVELDDRSARGSTVYDAVDSGWLTAAASALKARNSFMVVITGPPRGVLAWAADRTPYVFSDLGAIDATEVLERHVLGPAPDEAELRDLRARLARSGAAEALREQPEPAIAVALARTVRARRDLAEQVALLRDPSEQVRQWFSRHEDLEALCFAVSAAVLEGSSYLTVSDAAIQLHTALVRDPYTLTGLRYRDRLGHDQPWITVSGAADDGTARPFGPPKVSFRSPLVRQAVLAHAWSYLDGMRNELLAWLRRLLVHSDVEVRARAAVAAGVMAWSDHEHALHRYLSSWSSSTVWPVRQAAATALGVIGGQPGLTEAVWGRLDRWAVEGTSAAARRQAKTAATAAGGLLGRDAPDRALAVLRIALAWKDDWGNLVPVAWSVVRLNDQGRADAVLAALLEWSKAQDLSPMVAKSLSVFLFSAERTHPATAGEADRPSVLWTRVGELGRPLEELWARALARKPIQEQALATLRTWLTDYAERDPRRLPVVRELLIGIARRPGKHRERLVYWLGVWSADRERPCRAAASLREAVVAATSR